MSARRNLQVFIALSAFLSIATKCPAAEPGLPFTEDFANASLRNATETLANWSTRKESAQLRLRGPLFGAFGPDLVGSDITAEEHDTSSLALQDMDGDGDLDLVEGNRDEPCRLYFNDGLNFKGTLPSGFDMTADARDTRSVAVGDLDGDGDLDLVTGNFGGPNRLYLNNGFLNPFPLVVGADITADADDTASVALGDLDGDGDLDLVAGNNGTPNRLYLNNGTSDPFAGITGSDITSDASATTSIALGDLDADGDLDLVAANFQQPSQVYLNNGTDDPFAGVTATEFAPLSSDLEPVVVLGDMNGDGNLDIVKVGGELVEFDQIYFNNGTENPFEGVTGVPINSDEDLSFSVAVGDVDCDGDLDVLIGNVGLFSEGARNRLYLNNGTADPFSDVVGTNFTEDVYHTVAVALGDMDEDGDLDAIAGNRNQRKRFYLNKGTANPFDPIGADISPDMDSTNTIALGDLDADGDLDLVAGNDFAPNRLYLNNGTSDPFAGVLGSDITAETIFSLAVALGDVNGDGDLDLVTGNYSGKPNQLYLNNGTSDPFAGVVGSAITADGTVTYSVALGDLDADGDLDLVVGNFYGHNRLYLNNGTSDPFAGVTESVLISDASLTTSLALGDLDRDGDLDLVVGVLGQDLRNHRLYLNNGTTDPFGGAEPLDIPSGGDGILSLALGDVDGDGDLDLVTANLTGPVRLYLNNGTPDPFGGVMRRDIDADSTQSFNVALGDVDGDGDLDVILSKTDDGLNRLYLNNGTSDPFAGVVGADLAGDVANTHSLALGDMDGDGDLDVAIGNYSFTNRLYLNRKSLDPFSGLAGADITADAHASRSLAVGDVDRDGDPEFVAGNFGQPNRLYLNNGKMDPFEDATGSDITSDAQQTTSVALGDLDKDGDFDLVAGNSGQPNRYYANDGSADPFANASGANITPDADSTNSVALGDIDRDGDDDLVAGNFGQPNRLYLNNGTSNPWDGVTGSNITDDVFNTNSAALGDVDRDGFLDLVTGNLGQPNRLYLNQMATGPFSAGREISPATTTTTAMAVGDVDGDNDLDLVIAKGFDSPSFPARLYLNNGTADPFAGVAGTEITPATKFIITLALGDMDGDQDLDLVSNSLFETMQLYSNNGTSAPFSGVEGVDIASDTLGIGSLSRPVALGDMDGDGDLDIVEAPGSKLPIRLYLNNGTLTPFAGVAGVDITSDTGSAITALALADFDADGDLDIAKSVSGFNERNRLYLNNGTSTPFQGGLGSDITSDANLTRSFSVGDLNGDSRPDLVAGNLLSPSLIYLNNGTANPFAGVSGSIINSTTLEGVGSTALGDVDGDADLDVILAFGGNNPNHLFLNNGGPDPFEGIVGINLGSRIGGTKSVAFGDMDGDEDLDLVAGYFDHTDELFFNNLIPNPFLSGSDITTDADNTTSVALGDINLDGYLDVVAGNFNQQNRWYPNNGTENPFEGVFGIDAGAEIGNTEEIALADINRDGRPDIITGNLGQPNRVYLNVVTVFSPPLVGIEGIEVTSDADNTRSLVAFDMDRDGSLDIVAGNDGQPNRLYTRRRFNTASSLVTSLTVDTQPGDIHRILLDTDQTLPPNTSIDYWASADGGLRWSLVHPARLFSFPMPGSDLRWRAVLKSLSPRHSPRLDTLFLDLGPGIKANPANVDFMNRVPNSGPSEPVTVSLTNEGESDLTISGIQMSGGNAGEFIFSNDSGQIILNPGGARTFDVAFNPSSLGPKTADVTISSDDIDRPLVIVSLMGNGSLPPTPTATPTQSSTATPTPTQTPGISTNSPTPTETIDYDIHPDIPDGVVNAGDLLEWLEKLKEPESDSSLLFDFARFWKGTVE